MSDNFVEESNKKSSVSTESLTLKEPESSAESATQKAIDLLKKLREQGTDYVTKPLPKAKAKELAFSLGCKQGVIYNARAKILRDESQAQSSDVTATVEIDDVLKNAKPLEPQPEQIEEEKPFTPVPIESMRTFSDVIIDSVADLCASRGKAVPPARIDTVKKVYGVTLEAYNASIPKWALIPACLALTALVFVVPMRSEISRGLNKLLGREEVKTNV